MWSSEHIITIESLSVGFFHQRYPEIAFRIIVAHSTGVDTFTNGQIAVNSDVSPDRIKEKPDKINAIGIIVDLILNESLDVLFLFSQNAQGRNKLIGRELALLDVIRIDVLG
jgi:hypothetical protein